MSIKRSCDHFHVGHLGQTGSREPSGRTSTRHCLADLDLAVTPGAFSAPLTLPLPHLGTSKRGGFPSDQPKRAAALLSCHHHTVPTSRHHCWLPCASNGH